MFYMEVKVENQENFYWHKVDENVQLAFEDHPHTTSNCDDPQTKNHDIHNLKKVEHDDAVLESEVHYNHLEGSKELFNGDQRAPEETRLTAELQGQFEMDLINKIHMTIEKSTLPSINVQISQSEIKLFEEASAGKDWKLVVEVMFGEKSHSSTCQKYKIFKGGVSGLSRRKYTKNELIEFKNLKVNYHTTVDKNSKIIILLYYLTESKKIVLRQVLISEDLFIVEENKLINVDTEEVLKQYFDLFGSEFMDKLPNPYRINKNDKHTLNDQITKLEQYMHKKNKRFLNVVFLSFKFPHFCELYFKVNEPINEEQFSDDAFVIKKNALSNCLSEAIRQLQDLKIDSESKPEMLCNYLNPTSNLIFRININLRRVRLFIRKQFTSILNIIVSQDFEVPEGFAKFHTAKQLKEFYLQYYSYARKCKTSQGFAKPGHMGSSQYLQNPGDQPHLSSGLASKKPLRRADDDDYHQDELEQQEQSQNQDGSNDGYSGDKKLKKPNCMLKKLYIKKPPSNISPKENKYPTRGKTKAQQQQSENNQSKKNTLNKKIKEKQVQKKPVTSIPAMGAGLGMVNPLNPTMPMPFQMISPGGQGPMLGVFPLMQNAQKKDGPQLANGQKQPQIAAIPIGMQGMPGMPGMGGMAGMPMNAMGGMASMGGLPGGYAFGGAGMPQGMYGMQGGMMPAGFSGMPFGMMNPNAQQPKKEGGKDGKEQTQGSLQGQAPKQGIPMMPMQFGQGMGMQMPMMGGMGPMSMGGQMIPQGMMGMPGGQGMQGMVPMAMQGPNGQVIMVMAMMPQQFPQQLQTNSQQPNSQQQTSANSNTPNSQQPTQQSIQQMMAGGMPMGMMYPGGMQGMQSLQNMQALQGLQGLQTLQGLQGMQGMQGLQGMPGLQAMMMPQGMMMGGQGQQLALSGGNPQAGGNNPGSNPMQGLNLAQLGAMGGGMGGGMPMGFMMASQQNAQQNADQKGAADKNINPQANNKPLEPKKVQSNKKEEKPELFPPTVNNPTPANDALSAQKQSNNSGNGLPSFLTANNGQPQQGTFPPMVGGISAPPGFNLQKEIQKQKTGQQAGFPPGVMMGMSGPGGAGMVLTPEMLQQLGQSGQGVPQLGLPQGLSLPQGLNCLPQGIGIVPSSAVGNLPPGVGILTPQMLNSLPPQQKQMVLQQMQAMNGKLPLGLSGISGPFPPKKDEQKK